MFSPQTSVSAPLRRQFIYQYDLIRELVIRDMKLLYKRSIFGVGWTLIAPLLNLAVFVFVFQVVLALDILHYSSYVFTGLLVWTWFQTSLFQSAGVIISNRALIRQPGFPKPILPVVIVTTGLVHFVLALPILLIFLNIDGIEFHPVIFLLPILQLLQFFLTLSFAYFLAALNVTFRDTQHTLGVLLQMFFYLTPVFYDISSVPSELQYLYELNPMVHIVTAYRSILIDGSVPALIPLLWIGFGTLIALPLGHKLFLSQSGRFVEEL